MTPNKAAFHLGKAVNGLRTKPNPNQSITLLHIKNQTKPNQHIHPFIQNCYTIAQ
jgi:hypothetical protein